jgi:putative sterol carrier protein
MQLDNTRQVGESADMLEQPRDFIGNILAVLTSKPLARPDFKAAVTKWKMVVVLETDYYPVTVKFDKGIRVEHGDNLHPTIRVRAKLSTIIELVKGTTSPMRALLNGGLKVKGLLRHPRATLRFYKLISSSLHG